MTESLAEAIVAVAAAYAVLGLLVAVPFVLRGVDRVDPDAAEGSAGFRLLILPGCVALWPWVVARWRRGAPPREERSPHRRAASQEANP